ncbi:haloalkane dehalogenase [Burkholderia sp. PAMC 26561]|uniref:haloalkane dehalogenase n=1 Tax=Burkholderia sp. PAMC 26561 TaxID=1795043 RepID=UPI00076B2366|nr:haloalkane dehalogenase [Burkholderia sp. PAMC 26561]AME28365.1 haloalkane dehalogenase [Burkholderia sp. PAMC 26561]
MHQRSLKKLEVLGSQMAYVDVGNGPTILFLHGNPMSSYLWRNVIPHVAAHARCIAPDLIGFGDSDKPDLAYRVPDQARYLDQFIEKLGLDDVVLVLHDWGSALGLDWSRRHPRKVRGLALMEIICPQPTWLDMNPVVAQHFREFRDPGGSRKLLIDENAFIERIVPENIVRQLSSEDLDAYRRPFRDPASREPIWRFPNDLPIAGEPADVYAMAVAYHNWLLETDVPKLFFWADPGALISVERAAYYRTRLKACHSVALGKGIHYVQEDHPDLIGREIVSWLNDLPSSTKPR